MSVTMPEVMQVLNRHLPQGFSPKVAMILGSGLSSIAEQMTGSVSIPYNAIPGLHGGTVAGHASLMAAGHLANVPVICMRGRLHMYEGTSIESLRVFIRQLKHLGCQTLIVTGAVGSLVPEAGPGELMMINDHINFQPFNPLVGPNDESEGPRFVGMEDAYDPGLQEIMQGAANRLGYTLHRGVYLSTMGPTFETPAEIRAFKRWGADVVGMSVVPEVILARHCGLRVVCVAAITNAAAGMSHERITHDGTLQYGELAARKLTKLIPEFVKDLNDAMV
ncbi:MAG TPA: purine-nucleoside phosphorylase [Gammaproteobacteria bacterium]|jgi:xanthosine phosphorylase|nr:purine-nucleoside phosphorylase [Gammaproteobacteria bacterium]